MPLTRFQLLQKLQVVRLIEPLLVDQMKKDEEAIWSGDYDPTGRGSDWFKSFHASAFPGDNPFACARKAIYTLMGIPNASPVEPYGRAIMEAGLDIEDRVVSRLHRAGLLLSSPTGNEQTNFEVKEYWLTGHTDAIILPPGWDSPHALEIKTKDDVKVDDMRKGARSYDEPHYYQLMCYMYLTRIFHFQMGLDEGLKPCKDGTIIYFSRQSPMKSAEFLIEYDQDVVNEGLEKLSGWKQFFIDGKLPERPKSWRWTLEPCRWCELKKNCKLDDKFGIRRLDLSHTIAFAKEVNPDYDYKSMRQRVLDRWNS
jgi:hypothetical protein